MWNKRWVSPIYFFTTLVVLICTILIYDAYHSLSTFHNQSANEKINIKLALQRIPICTSNDRSRHRALLFTLHAWNQFAQHNHIQYWIAFETLLGYVHRRALLPHQPNIDLFIMAHHTSQLLHLSQLNMSSNYKLRVHPQWYLVEHSKRSQFVSEEIDFLAPNARFIDTDEMVYLDIWPVYDYNPNETRAAKNSRAMLTVYDPNHTWRSTPKEWTFPLRECEFSGMKVWCPSEAGKLVDDMYGEKSVNMSSRRCVNGSWEESAKHGSTETTTTTTTTASISATKKRSTTSGTSSTKFNDYELVEKALKHIPTCTAEDRSAQRVLLTNLQAWARLAEKYNLKYWISYGSLVGYVQRGGLLPHDADIDVIIMTDDIPKLINISKFNFSAEYEIKVQPQWHIIGYKKRAYFPDEGIHFVAPDARFINRKTYNHVDIFPGYTFDPRDAINVTGNERTDNITIYDSQYKWLSFPRSWTYPLRTCYFSEIKVLCPAQPKKMVESLYGTKALTKSDTKCVNGSWVNDD